MNLSLALEKVMTTWTPLAALATKELTSLLVGGNCLSHLLVRCKSNLHFVLVIDSITIISFYENKLLVFIKALSAIQALPIWDLGRIDL